MSVHPNAQAFGGAAAAYERARPGYPPEAVAWMLEAMGVGAGSTVVDLAAGTGKLTRRLVGACGHVVAVEPVGGMRATLQDALPDVEVVEAVAESLPLASESADGVTVAQAFHWFRPEAALPEIHRVLRPGGALGLVWNVWDASDALQASLEDIITRYGDRSRSPGPGPVTERSRGMAESLEAVAGSDLFGEPVSAHFENVQRLPKAALIDRVESISFVAAADAKTRDDVFADLDELIADVPAEVVLRYLTDVNVYPRS